MNSSEVLATSSQFAYMNLVAMILVTSLSFFCVCVVTEITGVPSLILELSVVPFVVAITRQLVVV